MKSQKLPSIKESEVAVRETHQKDGVHWLLGNFIDPSLEMEFNLWQYKVARQFKNSIALGGFMCSAPMLTGAISGRMWIMFWLPIVTGIASWCMLQDSWKARPTLWNALVGGLFTANFTMMVCRVLFNYHLANDSPMTMDPDWRAAQAAAHEMMTTLWAAQQIIFILGLTAPLRVAIGLLFMGACVRFALTLIAPGFFPLNEALHFGIATLVAISSQIQLQQLLRLSMLQHIRLREHGVQIAMASWLQTSGMHTTCDSCTRTHNYRVPGMFSRLFTLPMREPTGDAFYEVSNPVRGSVEEKISQLDVLTAENALILDKVRCVVSLCVAAALPCHIESRALFSAQFFQEFCRKHKFDRKESTQEVKGHHTIQLKHNRKSEESIRQKAVRPEILAEWPRFDVEHVRDTFRFKAVVYTVVDAFEFLYAVSQCKEVGGGKKWRVIKLDVEKLLNPKGVVGLVTVEL
jgi:hypothetical protein